MVDGPWGKNLSGDEMGWRLILFKTYFRRLQVQTVPCLTVTMQFEYGILLMRMCYSELTFTTARRKDGTTSRITMCG